MMLQFLKIKKTDGSVKHCLALVLGTYANKVCYLHANEIPTEVKNEIRLLKNELNNLTIPELRNWFKSRIKNLNSKKIYKEAHLKNVEIEYSFEIGGV